MINHKLKERMMQLAQQLGCSYEQIYNFDSVGYYPQPKQIEFHAAARQCDAADGPDQIGFGGARGPGKSHATFAQVALDDCRRIPALKALYLRKVGKQAREQFEDLRRAVLPNVKHAYDKRTGVVSLWKDSRIVLGHFKSEQDIDNYLGIEYDVILVEEATTLTQSKYKALRDSNRTSKAFRPRVYTTTNPGNIGHRWYKARFVTPHLLGVQGDTRFIPATIDDNHRIDAGYKKKLEENVGWKLLAHRYGNWDIAAGQYFENFNADKHVISTFQPPKDWDFWLTMDYGFTHPTVFLLLAETGDGEIIVLDEHVKSGWLPATHAKAVKSMIKRWNLNHNILLKIPAGHDVFNKTDEKTIAEKYQAEGLRLTPANNDRITGAAEVSNRLGTEANELQDEVKPTLFIFPHCQQLIQCLPTLQHDPKRPDDVLKVDIDEDGDGGDDPYDALRYGLMSRPTTQPSFFYAPPHDVIEQADKSYL